MTLYELFPSSTVKHFGKYYEVLEIPEKYSQSTVFQLRCLVCSYVFKNTAKNMLRDRKSCLCSKKANCSPDRKLKVIQDKIKNKNLTLISADLSLSSGYLELRCNTCEYITKSRYNSFIYQDGGCAACNKARHLTQPELHLELTNYLLGQPYQLESFEYNSGDKERLRVICYCEACEDSWETTVQSIRNGCRCTKCASYGFNTRNPALLYLARVISEDNILIGYKYGITGDLERRLYEHGKYNEALGIKFELSYKWEYQDGQRAREHERKIKARLPSYFLKHELPKGYTETFPVQDFCEFLEIQLAQY
jgi:predicted GIY-YIG superfamily endonuclease